MLQDSSIMHKYLISSLKYSTMQTKARNHEMQVQRFS